ncbi:glucokinase [Parapedobacter defluvii]|uniref:Glucokinase n=1 Tax=Parapedobacter defluvii TaxID=2045106 RepID=A0ABQ1M617_9SPHI|nr:ROK family protein [Parapedobacter defluvii]GGC34270.1 glucokinase [Parapedobacter defluvii]
MGTATAIGIDLGGTNIKGALVDMSGKIIHRMTQATNCFGGEKDNGQRWKKAIFQMVAELKKRSAVAAVGIAAPGLPNAANSAIRLMPERLEGLAHFVWADYLREKSVWVLNDAHAALIAEARFGVAKGSKNVVMLTLGTGVGGGILIDGKLYQGKDQMAGHLGHMTLDVDREDAGITGMPGTLEDAIGSATIFKRSFGRFASTNDLVEAYKGGDHFATYVWLNAVRKLALGLCSLNNLLSPDLFILGGGITHTSDALYKPLADFMDVYAWKNAGRKTPVLQAHYSDMAGAVGAAGFAFLKMGIIGGNDVDVTLPV